MKYLAQAAADEDFANGNQRYYMSEIFDAWKSNFSSGDDVTLLILELDNIPNVDPWARLIIKSNITICKSGASPPCKLTGICLTH